MPGKNWMSEENKIFGYIYRIYHENYWKKNSKGEFFQPCYIGKTEETIHKRFLGHKRDAKNAGGKKTGGDGKLHFEMHAKNCIGFHIEELDKAFSPQDLSEKESLYIKKFDSIKNGWNKITASSTKTIRGQNVSISIDGRERKFESIAQLCREIEISGTSLQHWLKKELSLDEAVKKSIEGKLKQQIKNEKVIEVFKRKYSTINELVRDKKVNKLNLSAVTIRRRMKDGISIEDALLIPLERKIKSLSLKLSDGSISEFKNLQDAHTQLKERGIEVPPYSTIVSFINKGYTPEQAFAFEKRPWESKYEKCDLLIAKQGYEYVGEKNAYSIPVIVDIEKKIYTTIKLFAKAYGLDYTTVAEKLKQGQSVEKILKKSGHL